MKDLFWLIFSELSVDGFLVHCCGPEIRQNIMLEKV